MTVMTEDANHFLQMGLAASQANDTDGALAHFQKAASAAPHSGIPHFLIGSELAASRRYEEAEAAFANAVLLSPEFPMPRYQLGLLQFTSGRVSMAMLTWEPLLKLESGPLPSFIKGFASMASDQFSEALEFFQQGLALNTDNPPLSQDIQMVMAEIRQKTGTSAPPPSAPAADVAEEAPSNAHVLLANYQQSGLPH